jgi:hypothetical protein
LLDRSFQERSRWWLKNNFHCFNDFINKNRNAVLHRKLMGNCRDFSNRYWPILPCLLLADGLIPQIFHHTQPIGTFAQRISGYQLDLAFPCGFLIAFKNCPEAIQ